MRYSRNDEAFFPNERREDLRGARHGNLEATAITNREISTPLAELIDCHRTAFAVADAVAWLEDSVALGRQPTPSEARRVRDALNFEGAAMSALCGYRCLTIEDLAFKLAYISRHWCVTLDASADQVSILAESIKGNAASG